MSLNHSMLIFLKQLMQAARKLFTLELHHVQGQSYATGHYQKNGLHRSNLGKCPGFFMRIGTGVIDSLVRACIRVQIKAIGVKNMAVSSATLM